MRQPTERDAFPFVTNLEVNLPNDVGSAPLYMVRIWFRSGRDIKVGCDILKRNGNILRLVRLGEQGGYTAGEFVVDNIAGWCIYHMRMNERGGE